MSHSCALSPVKTQAATFPGGQKPEQREHKKNSRNPKCAGTQQNLVNTHRTSFHNNGIKSSTSTLLSEIKLALV